jgi:hypothetical protein
MIDLQLITKVLEGAIRKRPISQMKFEEYKHYLSVLTGFYETDFRLGYRYLFVDDTTLEFIRVLKVAWNNLKC